MLDSTLEVTSTNDQEATPSDSVTDDAVTELPTSSSSSETLQGLPNDLLPKESHSTTR